ncbi:MAG TPA: prepilin-type N-terminal cleavage/methylation domain-containing protein [Thermoanaerobaculia bacterium]|nr:prepilin-type N-terminal cleavage/methylation domain-containing protein [Thermoanaerobaculia bacterium]
MNIPLRRSSGGYSLAELLVVVAIIGILSLVSVPAFMSYRNSAKLRSSMRQFVADLREARQRAITENHPTMISFRAGTGNLAYRSFNGTVADDGTVTYSAHLPASNRFERRLESDVYFAPTTNPCLFADTITSPSQTSGWNDIVFNANGTVANVPSAALCESGGLLTGIVVIRNDKAPQNRKTFTFEIVPTGRIRVD